MFKRRAFSGFADLEPSFSLCLLPVRKNGTPVSAWFLLGIYFIRANLFQNRLQIIFIAFCLERTF